MLKHSYSKSGWCVLLKDSDSRDQTTNFSLRLDSTNFIEICRCKCLLIGWRMPAAALRSWVSVSMLSPNSPASLAPWGSIMYFSPEAFSGMLWQNVKGTHCSTYWEPCQPVQAVRASGYNTRLISSGRQKKQRGHVFTYTPSARDWRPADAPTPGVWQGYDLGVWGNGEEWTWLRKQWCVSAGAAPADSPPEQGHR